MHIKWHIPVIKSVYSKSDNCRLPIVMEFIKCQGIWQKWLVFRDFREIGKIRMGNLNTKLPSGVWQTWTGWGDRLIDLLSTHLQVYDRFLQLCFRHKHVKTECHWFMLLITYVTGNLSVHTAQIWRWSRVHTSRKSQKSE